MATLVGRSGQEVLAELVQRFHAGQRRGATGPGLATPVQVVRANRAGAVQAVNLEPWSPWRTARQHDRARPTVGDFVTPGTVIVEVYGAALPAGEQQLRGLFALGQERTIEQDPAFALRILVDIAIKALSPAINDPTTAVQVLDHIEARRGLSRTELRRAIRTLRPRRRCPGDDPWSRLGGVPPARRDRDP